MFHLFFLFSFFLFSLLLFVLFLLCGLCRKYGVSVCFRCEGCSQLALTSSGSLPVHFRVLLLLCWFILPFIRPSFLLCYYISPGCMSILWTSWVRVWGWVSDRVTTDPLFVCPMLCCVYFPMGERCTGLEWVVSLLGVDSVRRLPSGCCHCVV